MSIKVTLNGMLIESFQYKRHQIEFFNIETTPGNH